MRCHARVAFVLSGRGAAVTCYRGFSGSSSNFIAVGSLAMGCSGTMPKVKGPGNLQAAGTALSRFAGFSMR
jgi:hypothetical protein